MSNKLKLSKHKKPVGTITAFYEFLHTATVEQMEDIVKNNWRVLCIRPEADEKEVEIFLNNCEEYRDNRDQFNKNPKLEGYYDSIPSIRPENLRDNKVMKLSNELRDLLKRRIEDKALEIALKKKKEQDEKGAVQEK